MAKEFGIRRKDLGVIYCVRNIKNDKLYIGQTVHNLAYRKQRHLNDTRRGCTQAFHMAIRKYGESSFSWRVLEDEVPNEELNDLEILYIDLFGTYLQDYYNVTMGGESSLGFFPSEETRKKMSMSALNKPPMTDETKRLIAIASTGRVFTEEAKRKSSATKMGHEVNDEARVKISAGHRGKKMSEKTRDKMRNRPTRGTPVRQYNLLNEFLNEWKSLAEATRNTGVSPTNIGNVCANKSKTAGGFKWEYSNPDSSTRAKGKPRHIGKYSLEGVLLKEYSSIKRASDEFGVFISTIQGACKRDGAISCGYKWEYLD